MLFSCEELSILETLTLDKIVKIRCKILELRMNESLMDNELYLKEKQCLENQLDEMVVLHDKFIKKLEV